MDSSKLKNSKGKKNAAEKDQPAKQLEDNKDLKETNEVDNFKLTGQPRQLTLKDL